MTNYGHNISFLGLWSAGPRAQGLLPLPSLGQIDLTPLVNSVQQERAQRESMTRRKETVRKKILMRKEKRGKKGTV